MSEKNKSISPISTLAKCSAHFFCSRELYRADQISSSAVILDSGGVIGPCFASYLSI